MLHDDTKTGTLAYFTSYAEGVHGIPPTGIQEFFLTSVLPCATRNHACRFYCEYYFMADLSGLEAEDKNELFNKTWLALGN